jgi:hypothetical protein
MIRNEVEVVETTRQRLGPVGVPAVAEAARAVLEPATNGFAIHRSGPFRLLPVSF